MCCRACSAGKGSKPEFLHDLEGEVNGGGGLVWKWTRRLRGGASPTPKDVPEELELGTYALSWSFSHASR